MSEGVISRPAGSRILTLDVIRGIAVMGIFSVNIIDFSLIQQAYLNPAAAGGATGADLYLWLANHIFIDEKMRTLFSILFGASTLLVIDRAMAKGESRARVHYGRMVALLLFGLIHYYLIWGGDILVSYATTGMIAFLFTRRKAKTMLIWAACLIGLSTAMLSLVSFQMYSLEHKVAAHTATVKEAKQWKDMGSFAQADPKKAAETTRVMRSAWPERTVARAKKEEFNGLFGGLLFLPETLGLMLLGMAGFRGGFLTGDWSRAAYRRVALVGIPIGMAFSIVSGLSLVRLGFPAWLLMGSNYGFGTLPHIAQALGYAALVVLLIKPGGFLTQRIAATGRAAFTNYLGTSILASLLFFGSGLALFGTMSRFGSWALAVPGIWLIMLAWSKPWLDRFNYGPFEWAWRSLARLSPQPMRKNHRLPAIEGVVA